MRNISFALTTEQFRNRSKRVSRRVGWEFLEGGEQLRGVVKSQGLKKGEHPVPLGVIYVDLAHRERLDRMTDDLEYGRREVILEGFPDMTPAEFVAMFCAHNKIRPIDRITRIAYSYIETN